MKLSKKYIRANGGSSRANNISEAVKDLDSIPQGSGGIIVHFEWDKEGDAVIADKTPSEVMQLMNDGVLVYGYITVTKEEESFSVNLGAPIFDIASSAIGFSPVVAHGDMYCFILANGEGWKVNGL